MHNRLRLEVFGEILADPPSLLTRVYGWGTDDLLFDRIARHGAEFLQAIGINGVAIVRLDPEASAAYQAVTDPDDVEELVTLRVALFASLIGDLLLEVGFSVSELPPDASGHAGMILEPLVPDLGGITTTPTGDLQVPLGDRVVMQVRPGIDLSKRVGLVVRPGDVDVQYPFAPGESMPDTGYGVAFAFKPPTPMLLVGAAGASRVEVRKASATFDLDHKEGELEAVAGVSADDVVAVLSGNDFDGFLGGLLGGRDVNIPLKLAITWSSRTGFRINGGAGFEVGVDPHLALGPVRAEEVRLRAARHRRHRRRTRPRRRDHGRAERRARPVRVLALGHRCPAARSRSRPGTRGRSTSTPASSRRTAPACASIPASSWAAGSSSTTPPTSATRASCSSKSPGSRSPPSACSPPVCPTAPRAIRSSSRSAPRSRRSRSASASPSRASAGSSR